MFLRPHHGCSPGLVGQTLLSVSGAGTPTSELSVVRIGSVVEHERLGECVSPWQTGMSAQLVTTRSLRSNVTMRIAFVGLGKMGGNMTLRLVHGAPDGSAPGGHEVVGYARDPNPELQNVAGVTLVDSLDKLVAQLQPPRVVWVMVPAGDATEQVIRDLAERLSGGDIVIDGGNSHYKDTLRRAEGLSKRGIGFLDVGTSGGVWGRDEGYCMMVGGDA